MGGCESAETFCEMPSRMRILCLARVFLEWIITFVLSFL